MTIFVIVATMIGAPQESFRRTARRPAWGLPGSGAGAGGGGFRVRALARAGGFRVRALARGGGFRVRALARAGGRD
ncbi:MAG: hypothetical protein LBQ79_10435, partial [Deltaproteobacteria bacterium]|nr:hypothetical protein [Deltaproteobacteria bacterium]